MMVMMVIFALTSSSSSLLLSLLLLSTEIKCSFFCADSSGRCVLAGDHLQLPPTIVSEAAAKAGLSKTLLERVVHMHGDVVRLLDTQYRSNQAIMKWSSDALYESRLQAGAAVEHQLLCELPGVESDENTTVPVVFIDTAGCSLDEDSVEDGESRGNKGEVELVEVHLEALLAAGVKQEDIGIITPYNMQVEYLRAKLSPTYDKLEIKSVDGFQVENEREKKTGWSWTLKDKIKAGREGEEGGKILLCVCILSKYLIRLQGARERSHYLVYGPLQ